MYLDDVWKSDNKADYYRIASDRPYHYLGSGTIFYLMGHAFGEQMKDLLED